MPRDYRLYLDDILDGIRQIRTYVKGMNYDQFASDRKTIDAVTRNLEIIGEAARSLPDEVTAKAREVEWRKIVGLRNLLAHQYFGINTRVVWDIVETRLASLELACERILHEDE